MPIPLLQGRSVLVTGGGGFIGSHLVDALLDRGARVRVLDNFSTGRRENLIQVLDRVELIDGDICDLATCRRAAAGADFVFHEAALGSVPRSMKEPATTFSVNVQGTINVFTACRDARVGRVVYASSSSVYGDSTKLPKREGEEGRPLSPYALSKRVGEEAAELFGRCYGLWLVGLRYFNVYGPRQDPSGPYAAVIPRLFGAVLGGKPPVIFGDGGQSRDFTFVNDVVTANLLAAGAPEAAYGRVYNIAGGLQTTVADLVQRIRKMFDGGPAPRFEPAREGDIRHSCGDLSLARAMLGYEPAIEIGEGLRQSSRYYATGARERAIAPDSSGATSQGGPGQR